MRDIGLNCQYMIIFKNNRDVNQIEVLGRQLGIKHLSEAYRECIKVPYNPLIINIHPKTPEILKLQSNIFGYRRIYVKK